MFLSSYGKRNTAIAPHRLMDDDDGDNKDNEETDGNVVKKRIAATDDGNKE